MRKIVHLGTTSYKIKEKMEDLKPNVQNLTPPAPPMASRKRSLDTTNPNFEDSNYFKMRAILKDIRPHFLEVLRTPEFENCKAADEIKDKMKTFMNLYKEMTSERISLTKCQNVTGQTRDDQKPSNEQHTNYVKSEEKPSVVIPSLFDDISKQNSYIVGGSAFGWNFITFTSSEVIYYGRTKEAFRAANVVPN